MYEAYQAQANVRGSSALAKNSKSSPKTKNHPRKQRFIPEKDKRKTYKGIKKKQISHCFALRGRPRRFAGDSSPTLEAVTSSIASFRRSLIDNSESVPRSTSILSSILPKGLESSDSASLSSYFLRTPYLVKVSLSRSRSS